MVLQATVGFSFNWGKTGLSRRRHLHTVIPWCGTCTAGRSACSSKGMSSLGLLLLPAVTVVVLLVKISSTEHLRTPEPCPCPQEDLLLWRPLVRPHGAEAVCVSGWAALTARQPVEDSALVMWISISFCMSFGDKDMHNPLAVFCQHLFFFQQHERSAVLEMRRDA